MTSAAVGLLSLVLSGPFGQCCGAASAPAVTYAPAPAVTYAPAPAVAYAPVGYPTATCARPVVAMSPVVQTGCCGLATTTYMPVTTYAPARVVSYRPARRYVAPVTAYSPVVAYSPTVACSPVVTYSPVVSYSPAVVTYAQPLGPPVGTAYSARTPGWSTPLD